MTCDQYAKRHWQTIESKIEIFRGKERTVYFVTSVNCENCKSKEVYVVA